jgi:hypothetical protein
LTKIHSGSAVVTRRNFELLLLAAALFEALHLIGLFARRAEVDGLVLAVLFTVGGPLFVLLLGLAVTRLGSSLAKWLLILLVAVALLSAVRIGTAQWLENPALLAGAIAGLCQLAAVSMLFTRGGRSWTGRKPSAPLDDG